MVTLFDARWKGKNGISRFSSELLTRLKFDMYLVNDSIKPTSPLDTIWLTLYLFFVWVKKKGDFLYFTPGYNSPLLFLSNVIITVHDLNHYDLPCNSSIMKRFYYRFVLMRACRKSKLILTVSDFSRSRIIKWSGVSPDKVIKVGNGVDDSFSPDVEKFSPGFKYFLCIGNRKAHKNENRVIEAFSEANIDPKIKLVFNGYSTPYLSDLIHRLKMNDRIVFKGDVEDSEIPSLYAGAIALVFPSLYEGFGLPIIEAMACGTPVITSTCTSLPEIAGDAALLIDPESVQDISLAIHRLSIDDQLRSRLHHLGLERARHFRWNMVSDKVKKAIKTI